MTILAAFGISVTGEQAYVVHNNGIDVIEANVVRLSSSRPPGYFISYIFVESFGV